MSLVANVEQVIAKNLREARTSKGWSLDRVQDLTNGEFKASIVGAYERAERAIGIARLMTLCKLYGISVTEVLDGEIVEPERCPACNQVVSWEHPHVKK